MEADLRTTSSKGFNSACNTHVASKVLLLVSEQQMTQCSIKELAGLLLFFTLHLRLFLFSVLVFYLSR